MKVAGIIKSAHAWRLMQPRTCASRHRCTHTLSVWTRGGKGLGRALGTYRMRSTKWEVRRPGDRLSGSRPMGMPGWPALWRALCHTCAGRAVQRERTVGQRVPERSKEQRRGCDANKTRQLGAWGQTGKLRHDPTAALAHAAFHARADKTAMTARVHSALREWRTRTLVYNLTHGVLTLGPRA